MVGTPTPVPCPLGGMVGRVGVLVGAVGVVAGTVGVMVGLMAGVTVGTQHLPSRKPSLWDPPSWALDEKVWDGWVLDEWALVG